VQDHRQPPSCVRGSAVDHKTTALLTERNAEGCFCGEVDLKELQSKARRHDLEVKVVCRGWKPELKAPVNLGTCGWETGAKGAADRECVNDSARNTAGITEHATGHHLHRPYSDANVGRCVA